MDIRDVVAGKVRNWAVVGKLAGVPNRRRGDIVVLANLPREVVLAIDGYALEVTMAGNEGGEAAQNQGCG